MGAIKIQVAMGGTLAKVSLARPDKLNAFDRDMLRELADIVRGVADSAKCRVVRSGVGQRRDPSPRRRATRSRTTWASS